MTMILAKAGKGGAIALPLQQGIVLEFGCIDGMLKSATAQVSGLTNPPFQPQRLLLPPLCENYGPSQPLVQLGPYQTTSGLRELLLPTGAWLVGNHLGTGIEARGPVPAMPYMPIRQTPGRSPGAFVLSILLLPNQMGRLWNGVIALILL